MNLEKKESEVAYISEQFAKAQAAFLVDYKGCSCSELTELRAELRKSGSRLKVLKNTLSKRALGETSITALGEHFIGPTAVVWTDEPPVAAKVVSKFAQDNESFELKAGVVDGEVIAPAEVDTLAKLPSKEELIAKLLSLINAPATRLLQTVNAPAGQLVRLLGAWRDKLEETKS